MIITRCQYNLFSPENADNYQQIASKAEPTKDGYVFGGWSGLPATMPDHDVEITGQFYLVGDVNGDGIINTVDATYILMYLVDKTPADFIVPVADVDGNGSINTVDASAILKKLVE